MRGFLHKRSFVWALLVVAWPATALQAQDISGTWQSTTDGRQRVLEISVLPGGEYRGQLYFRGEKGGALNGNVISTITARDGAVSFTEDRLPGTFEGTLSADGKTLAGTWQAYAAPRPMTFERATPQTAWVIDPSPHTIRFVTVDKDVALEVLDWGGNGPPLVFLAGLGNTAHIFDSFAVKFTATHHVYAITRRGYGMSSAPPPPKPQQQVDNAISRGIRGYTGIRPPFLAIYAVPAPCKPDCDTDAAKAERAMNAAQVKAVEAHYPKARIVRLPGASHYVYQSNEADVEREMKAWLDGLPAR
jgi:hypothetical protein